LLLAGIQLASVHPAAAQRAGQLTSAVPTIHFAADGNTLLSADVLADILQPVAGPVTIDKVREIADRLQDAYRREGFGAVVVALPEQTVVDDTVHLQVIEGRLDNIVIQGNRIYSDQNIRRSLPSLEIMRTPDLVAIDANLLQVNENPAKTTRVTFQPGVTAGKVDALVVTSDRDPLQQSAAVENTGSDATGRWRLSYSLRHANLFDRDQMLGMRAEMSPIDGAHSNAASLNYQIPLYRYLSAVELVANYSDVESRDIPTAAGDAFFTGRGHALGLRYRHFLPRYLDVRHRAQLGFDARRYDSGCSVGELGSAGCGSAGTEIRVRPLTLGYEARIADRYNLSLSYSRNLSSGGFGVQSGSAVASAGGATRRYAVLRGGLAASYRLAGGSTIAWRSSLQHSDDTLIPGEQFGVGGAGSVRGYEERELAGDQGQSASIEFVSAPWLLGSGTGSSARQLYNGVAFVDWGRVENSGGIYCDIAGSSCAASSIGAGLRWRYQDRWSLRVDLARTLERGPRTKAGEFGAHVSLSYGL